MYKRGHGGGGFLIRRQVPRAGRVGRVRRRSRSRNNKFLIVSSWEQSTLIYSKKFGGLGGITEMLVSSLCPFQSLLQIGDSSPGCDRIYSNLSISPFAFHRHHHEPTFHPHIRLTMNAPLLHPVTSRDGTARISVSDTETAIKGQDHQFESAFSKANRPVLRNHWSYNMVVSTRRGLPGSLACGTCVTYLTVEHNALVGSSHHAKT